MRLVSSLIFDLARAVDVQGLAAGERGLEVPAAVLPVAQLPLAQLDTITFNVADVQRTSFFNHSELIRTNQVDTAVQVCTFGQGLWRLYFDVWYASNFDAFTAGGNGARVLLGATAAAQRFLFRLEPKIGDVQRRQIEFSALFPDDGWVCFLGHFTTGVGQTGHVKLAVWATKLL